MRRSDPGTGQRRAFAARLAQMAAVALLLTSVGALVRAWTDGDRVLARLETRAAEARERLGIALRDHHGIALYASFDESFPRDVVSGRPVHTTGAVRVPGALGFARRFDGAGASLYSSLRWSRIGRDGLAVTLLARFPKDSGDEELRLFWDHSLDATFGLRLRDGFLEAVFTDAAGTHVLSAPAPAAGRFAPIAFSIGLERAALFTDGAERAACDVSRSIILPGHVAAIGTDNHHPPAFDMDEWCIWGRPLHADEVARLAATRRPVTELLAPKASKQVRRAESRVAAFRALLAFLGTLGTVAQTSPAVLDRSVPALELRLSHADRRHFNAAHLESAENGFRTPRAAHARLVQAAFGGRTERVAAWLDECVFDAPLSGRPAFVLAAEGEIFGNGSGAVRLYPPEQYGERNPDAARPLPLDPASLVRLHVNGDFLGLYCLVPFEAPAAPWFGVGAHDPSRPGRLHFAAAASSPAAGAGLSEEEREDAWRRMLARLRTDSGFPLTPHEARFLARRHGERRLALRLSDPAPGPETLLGDNPAAFYVTGDLDLSAAGPGVVWHSSDPAAITPEGRVSRPTDGRTRTVELQASFPGGETRTFRFRVMPHIPALPALFLSFGRPLDKVERSEFACLRIPAGEGSTPEWLFGTGDGGAKLRGNTSYLKGRRRSMNLKFDEPVAMPGAGAPVRHLLLLSGYADPSRLRNALSFDAFRAMDPAAPFRSTVITWTEVFFNGAYAGVWECCPRLQDVLGEPFSDLYKVRSSHGLWTRPDASAESVDRVDGVTGDEAYAPIRDIVRLVSSPDAAAFARDAGNAFDIPELLDFFLLLNFTGNEDGRLTNQFIGRRGTDGRWLLLPWDYDKTFLPGHTARRARPGDSGCLTNPLFRRLFTENPALRDRLAARWRNMRSNALSDEWIDRWIDERATLLAPYMADDYRAVPPLGHDGDYAASVEALRAEAHASAAWLDAAATDGVNH